MDINDAENAADAATISFATVVTALTKLRDDWASGKSKTIADHGVLIGDILEILNRSTAATNHILDVSKNSVAIAKSGIEMSRGNIRLISDMSEMQRLMLGKIMLLAERVEALEKNPEPHPPHHQTPPPPPPNQVRAKRKKRGRR